MNHLGINYLGTLLSSQRTDAHPRSPFSRLPAGGSVPIYQSSWPALSRLPAFLRVPEPYQSFFPVFIARSAGVSDVPKPYQAFQPALSAAFRELPDQHSRSGATVETPKRLEVVPGVRRPWDQPPR